MELSISYRTADWTSVSTPSSPQKRASLGSGKKVAVDFDENSSPPPPTTSTAGPTKTHRASLTQNSSIEKVFVSFVF